MHAVLLKIYLEMIYINGISAVVDIMMPYVSLNNVEILSKYIKSKTLK